MNQEVLLNITENYLKKLENPQEVFNNDSWKELTEPFSKETSKDMLFILNCRINRIAPQFGLVWHNKKDRYLYEIINDSFDNLKSRRVGDWWIKGVVLIVAGLRSATGEEIFDFAEKLYVPSKQELQEANCDYDRIRININNYLTKEKDNITDDNYEEFIKRLIKITAKSLLLFANFSKKIDHKKYVLVFYYRFYSMMTYEEISEKTEIQTGHINNILNKFYDEINNTYPDFENKKLFCRKFENFYDSAYNALDSSVTKLRNKRLDNLKRFQRYLITENLAEYIS